MSTGGRREVREYNDATIPRNQRRAPSITVLVITVTKAKVKLVTCPQGPLR